MPALVSKPRLCHRVAQLAEKLFKMDTKKAELAHALLKIRHVEFSLMEKTNKKSPVNM